MIDFLIELIFFIPIFAMFFGPGIASIAMSIYLVKTHFGSWTGWLALACLLAVAGAYAGATVALVLAEPSGNGPLIYLVVSIVVAGPAVCFQLPATYATWMKRRAVDRAA